MARKTIKKYQVFWTITGCVCLWILLLVVFKIWHIVHEPEKAIKEERRHHTSNNLPEPFFGTVSGVVTNLNNIKEGKFTEKAQWPKITERKMAVVPMDKGDEKSSLKESGGAYYEDQRIH